MAWRWSESGRSKCDRRDDRDLEAPTGRAVCARSSTWIWMRFTLRAARHSELTGASRWRLLVQPLVVSWRQQATRHIPFSTLIRGRIKEVTGAQRLGGISHCNSWLRLRATSTSSNGRALIMPTMACRVGTGRGHPVSEGPMERRRGLPGALTIAKVATSGH